ncbi:hypothetical protein ABTA90_19825, partial [Acinetobacter baumannii]
QEVVPAPLERAVQLARELAALAPLALAGMKRTFALLGPALGPEARAELEELRRRAFASDDAREGVTALRARRPPRFSGR